LAVDRSSKFFLTGSADSTVLVWSLVSLLSFSSNESSSGEPNRSPIHTLSDHTAAITAISLGHSSPNSNYAVSIAEDKSAIVWHYTNGSLLRVYLLEDIPRSVAIDSADRAIYVGYDDGSVQILDIYQQTSNFKSILSSPKFGQVAPIQPTKSSRRYPPINTNNSNETDPILCLSVSYDSTRLISGHRSGKICLWDVGRRQFLDELCVLPGSVTNLVTLPIDGILRSGNESVRIRTITKPKFEPEKLDNFTLTVEFPNELGQSSHWLPTTLEKCISSPCFSANLAQSAIHALHQSRHGASKSPNDAIALEEDFVSFDGSGGELRLLTKDEQLSALQQQLDSLKRTQRESSKIISELRRERTILLAENKKYGNLR
jgi:pre-rRNA-processing protein IPI3